MSSRRPLTRSYSGNERSNNQNGDEATAPGSRIDGRGYLHSVRPENRSTLCSVMAQLTEETQPCFETTLKSKSVSETCNVKFSCVVTGFPAPELTWYKDDMEMDRYCGLPKYEIFHNGNTHSLHIYNCTEDDAAIYQASARNTKGIVSCSGVLEVGTMNEYLIHQRFFAKLKQKAAVKRKELEVSRRRGVDNVQHVQDHLRISDLQATQRRKEFPSEGDGKNKVKSQSQESEVKIEAGHRDAGSTKAKTPEVANGVFADGPNTDISSSYQNIEENLNTGQTTMHVCDTVEIITDKQQNKESVGISHVKVHNSVESKEGSDTSEAKAGKVQEVNNGEMSLVQYMAESLLSQASENMTTEKVMEVRSIDHETVKEHSTDHPTVKQHVTEHSTVKQHVTERPTVKQHVTERPTVKQHVTERPTVKQHVTERPTVKQHVTERPTVKQHVTEHSTVKQHVTERPTVKQHVTERPTVKQHVTERPTVKQHVTERPTVKQHVTERPTVKQHVTERPTVKQHVTERPKVDENSIRNPTIKKRSTDHVTIKDHLIEHPTVKERSTEHPKIDENSVRNSTVKEGSTDHTIMKKRSTDHPVVKEQSTDLSVEKHSTDHLNVDEHSSNALVFDAANMEPSQPLERPVHNDIVSGVKVESLAPVSKQMESSSSHSPLASMFFSLRDIFFGSRKKTGDEVVDYPDMVKDKSGVKEVNCPNTMKKQSKGKVENSQDATMMGEIKVVDFQNSIKNEDYQEKIKTKSRVDVTDSQDKIKNMTAFQVPVPVDINQLHSEKMCGHNLQLQAPSQQEDLVEQSSNSHGQEVTVTRDTGAMSKKEVSRFPALSSDHRKAVLAAKEAGCSSSPGAAPALLGVEASEPVHQRAADGVSVGITAAETLQKDARSDRKRSDSVPVGVEEHDEVPGQRCAEVQPHSAVECLTASPTQALTLVEAKCPDGPQPGEDIKDVPEAPFSNKLLTEHLQASLVPSNKEYTTQRINEQEEYSQMCPSEPKAEDGVEQLSHHTCTSNVSDLDVYQTDPAVVCQSVIMESLAIISVTESADGHSEKVSCTTTKHTEDMTHKDSTVKTESNKAVETDTVNVDSNKAVETDTVNVDSNKAVETDTVNVDSNKAVETDTVNVDSNKAVKTNTVNLDSNKTMKTNTVNLDSNKAVKTNTVNFDSNKTMKTNTVNLDSNKAVETNTVNLDSNKTMKTNTVNLDSNKAVKTNTVNLDSNKAVKTNTVNVDSNKAVETNTVNLDSNTALETNTVNVDSNKAVKTNTVNVDSNKAVETNTVNVDSNKAVKTNTVNLDSNKAMETNTVNVDSNKAVKTNTVNLDSNKAVETNSVNLESNKAVETNTVNVDSNKEVETNTVNVDSNKAVETDTVNLDSNKAVETNTVNVDSNKAVKTDTVNVDSNKAVETNTVNVDSNKAVETNTVNVDSSKAVETNTVNVDSSKAVETNTVNVDSNKAVEANREFVTYTVSTKEEDKLSQNHTSSKVREDASTATPALEMVPRVPTIVIPPISVTCVDSTSGNNQLSEGMVQSLASLLWEVKSDLDTEIRCTSPHFESKGTTNLVLEHTGKGSDSRESDVSSCTDDFAEVLPSKQASSPDLLVSACNVLQRFPVLNITEPEKDQNTAEPSVDNVAYVHLQQDQPMLRPTSPQADLALGSPRTRLQFSEKGLSGLDSERTAGLPVVGPESAPPGGGIPEEQNVEGTPPAMSSCESSPRLGRAGSLILIPSATPEELASGARRKIFKPKSKEEEEADTTPADVHATREEVSRRSRLSVEQDTSCASPGQTRRSLASSTKTPPVERRSPFTSRRWAPLELQKEQEKEAVKVDAQPAQKEKSNPFKAPQVIRKIRAEPFSDSMGHLKLWCQFFNVLSDSTVTWRRDEVEIARVKRGSGDESHVALVVVQACSRDCGVYSCSIKNEFGTDSTDYLLSADILSEFCLREDLEVGEEVEMMPMLFSKGLADSGCWGERFFGRIAIQEARLGDGCVHKTSRARVIYGLDPVFESGSTCIVKVRNHVAYSSQEEGSLTEWNCEVTKEECKTQNTVREYCKIFTAEARVTDGFGSPLEVVPLFLMYRPSNTVPYGTAEADLKGIFLRYSLMDDTGRLIMRNVSEAEQKCCAFQHWIHQWTNGNLLVTQLEGVGMKITKVGVATKSKGYQGFSGNANPQVFQQFVTQHQCNQYCSLLGLRSLKTADSLQPPSKPKGSRSPLAGRKLMPGSSSPQLQKKGALSSPSMRRTTSSPKVTKKYESGGGDTGTQL